MSTIEITDESGTRVIDMEPVEKYERDLDEGIDARRFSFRRIDLLKSMGREQLLHLASILTSKVTWYARLYDASFSKEHAEMVKDLCELRERAKAAGQDLWPELDAKK